MNKYNLPTSIRVPIAFARNKIYAELIRNDKKYGIKSRYGNNLEVNFSAMTNNVEKMKKKMLTLISSIDARMKSRFLRGTYLPTINFIASSKNSDQSFLDAYIDTKRKNESITTLIVDEPQWVVDSRKDSPIHFYVAVGNKFLSNELLPKDAPDILIEEYRAKGYSLLSVPIGYYENFQDNIDGALMDIAGISTASSLKYISGVRWNEVKIDTYQNPFIKDIIEVGTGIDDISQYYDYFDLTRVSPELMSKPLFIHLDMSVKGDKTGISGVYITGKKPKIDGQDASRELFYRAAFSVSIKAPKGREISFDKNRTFIRWLREQGFSIKSVSCDSFQSSQIKQQLIADGFNVETISVDRVDTEKKICLPYAYFKSTLYDRRIEVYKECNLLTDEVLGLERESDGHIQHPEQGTQGCFTGDTKVSLVDGRDLTFLELVDEFNQGKNNYVYSFNETKKIIEPKLIENAWCTKKNAKLIEVELDNGEKLKCTPDHKFMLRDGSYCEAQYLKEHDSLMPLYRKYPTEVVSMKNYRMYYEPIKDKWHYEHRNLDKFKEIFGFKHKTFDRNKKAPYVTKYRKIVCQDILNHKVKSVTIITCTEDVYDITVQDNHNFALAAGIFVHNSKDQCDALVGSLYNASQHADEFAFEYGEDIDSTISANNNKIVTYDQSKKQIEVDMEEILKDLYDPLKEKAQNNFTDFGMGSAQILQNDIYMVSNGIII